MDSRDHLDDLLSEGRLSAPANERMFDRIYAATGGRRRRWTIAILAPAIGAVALLLLVRPPQPKEPSGFRSKGGGAPLVEMECADGALSACPIGSPLVFRVDGLAAAVFLQAYAEDPRGERIWFFPTPTAPAPAIAPVNGPQVIKQAVRLGGRAGRYDVHVVASTAPLDRPAVLQGTAATIVDKHVTALRVVER